MANFPSPGAAFAPPRSTLRRPDPRHRAGLEAVDTARAADVLWTTRSDHRRTDPTRWRTTGSDRRRDEPGEEAQAERQHEQDARPVHGSLEPAALLLAHPGRGGREQPGGRGPCLVGGVPRDGGRGPAVADVRPGPVGWLAPAVSGGDDGELAAQPGPRRPGQPARAPRPHRCRSAGWRPRGRVRRRRRRPWPVRPVPRTPAAPGNGRRGRGATRTAATASRRASAVMPRPTDRPTHAASPGPIPRLRRHPRGPRPGRSGQDRARPHPAGRREDEPDDRHRPRGPRRVETVGPEADECPTDRVHEGQGGEEPHRGARTRDRDGRPLPCGQALPDGAGGGRGDLDRRGAGLLGQAPGRHEDREVAADAGLRPGRWVEARGDGDAGDRRFLEALDEPGAGPHHARGPGRREGCLAGGRVPRRDPPPPPRRDRPPTARRRPVGRALLPSAGASTTAAQRLPRPRPPAPSDPPARPSTPVQPASPDSRPRRATSRTARTASRTASAVGPCDVMAGRPPTSPAPARAAAATRGRGPLRSPSTASAVSTRTTPASAGSGTTTPTADTRRTPSDRDTWTTACRARRSWACTARRGIPASAASASMRAGTSSGPLACSVLIPPSCPVLRAARSSRTSAPRTSPTTSRSGLIRSDWRTRSTSVTDPRPSTLGERPCSRTTWGWSGASSRTSSTTTTRSAGGHSATSAARTVVLPAPVPPVTTREARAATSARRTAATVGVAAPSATRAGHPTRSEPRDPQRQVRATVGQRREDGVQPDAAGQDAVDPRLGVVEPPSRQPGQPHGERPQVGGRDRRRRARRHAPGRPTRPRPR